MIYLTNKRLKNINTQIPDLDRIIDIAIYEDLSLGDITTESIKLNTENMDYDIIENISEYYFSYNESMSK
mgnify:CR=1 FL=1